MEEDKYFEDAVAHCSTQCYPVLAAKHCNIGPARSHLAECTTNYHCFIYTLTPLIYFPSCLLYYTSKNKRSRSWRFIRDHVSNIFKPTILPISPEETVTLLCTGLSRLCLYNRTSTTGRKRQSLSIVTLRPTSANQLLSLLIFLKTYSYKQPITKSTNWQQQNKQQVSLAGTKT